MGCEFPEVTFALKGDWPFFCKEKSHELLWQ
jgi:hypothetical protein